MHFADACRIALRALRLNRLRSGLTVLGIVVGISAVIIGVALGNGMKDWFDQLVGPLATQITVSTATGHVAGAVPIRKLSDNDVAALRNTTRAPDIFSVTPVVSGGVVMRVGTLEHKVTVLGSTADYLRVTDRKFSAGRAPSSAPTGTGLNAREIVIGPTPVRELFGSDPQAALGQEVRLARTSFRVVGVLTSNSQQDDVAVLPIALARTYLFGNDSTVNQIIVKASSPATVPAATDETTRILDERHHITDSSRRDYETLSLLSLIQQREQFMTALQAFIGAIAAISLVVGGIGVANIMLVSVTERTREIGLRKAVGASRSAIMRQFLMESAVLSSAGGIAGVAVGIVAVYLAAILIPRATDSFPPPVLSPFSVVVSFAISVAIGILAGLYPAHRAAHMRIIDALRYE